MSYLIGWAIAAPFSVFVASVGIKYSTGLQERQGKKDLQTDTWHTKPPEELKVPDDLYVDHSAHRKLRTAIEECKGGVIVWYQPPGGGTKTEICKLFEEGLPKGVCSMGYKESVGWVTDVLWPEWKRWDRSAGTLFSRQFYWRKIKQYRQFWYPPMEAHSTMKLVTAKPKEGGKRVLIVDMEHDLKHLTKQTELSDFKELWGEFADIARENESIVVVLCFENMKEAQWFARNPSKNVVRLVESYDDWGMIPYTQTQLQEIWRKRMDKHLVEHKVEPKIVENLLNEQQLQKQLKLTPVPGVPAKLATLEVLCLMNTLESGGDESSLAQALRNVYASPKVPRFNPVAPHLRKEGFVHV